LKKITLRIIGKVRNSVIKMKREGWESVASDVILDPKLEEALDGIEDYSHLLVFFWLSRVQKGRRNLKKNILNHGKNFRWLGSSLPVHSIGPTPLV